MRQEISKTEYATMRAQALERTTFIWRRRRLSSLLKDFLEAALEGEMEAHLDSQERGKGNKRTMKVNLLKFM